MGRARLRGGSPARAPGPPVPVRRVVPLVSRDGRDGVLRPAGDRDDQRALRPRARRQRPPPRREPALQHGRLADDGVPHRRRGRHHRGHLPPGRADARGLAASRLLRRQPGPARRPRGRRRRRRLPAARGARRGPDARGSRWKRSAGDPEVPGDIPAEINAGRSCAPSTPCTAASAPTPSSPRPTCSPSCSPMALRGAGDPDPMPPAPAPCCVRRAHDTPPRRSRDGRRRPVRPPRRVFFRYSTQRDWSVPHYEKMLEDTSRLAALYLE